LERFFIVNPDRCRPTKQCEEKYTEQNVMPVRMIGKPSGRSKTAVFHASDDWYCLLVDNAMIELWLAK
jgi:hypothetical protein